MERDQKTELLVGLFVCVGLLLLGGLILQFGRVREIFKDTYTLSVAFPNASGIKEGSPVFLGGSRVGKVQHNPRLNGTFTGVIIDLEIFHDVRIPADAAFGIGSAGLMGDSLIDIKPSGKDTNAFLSPEHEEVIVGVTTGGLSDLQSQAEVVGKKVDVVLDDIRSGLADMKAAINKVNKGALSDATLQDFRESMSHLNKTMARVDEKVLGDENATNLKTAIAELKDAATSFKTSAKNIEEQTKRLGPMFDKLEPAIAKADKVMTTADSSLQSIKTAADTFATAAKNISSGKGLLGALINDPKLKADFHDLIYNAKVNGFLFYKNSADKARATSEQAPKTNDRKPIFGR